MNVHAAVKALCQTPHPYFTPGDVVEVTPVEVGFTATTRSGTKYEIAGNDGGRFEVLRAAGAESWTNHPAYSCDVAVLVTTADGGRRLAGLTELAPDRYQPEFRTTRIVSSSSE